jgi:group II intron reverse transcriptase/maturase
LGPIFFKKIGGDGVIVVGAIRRVTVSSLQVRTLVSKAGSNASRGSDIHKPLVSNEVNIKDISNYKNLVSAYELIKSNPDNMTAGVSRETLDGMSKTYIERLQQDLKAGKFEFNPARRTQIPKPGKNEKRPLTIASPREKIVQKAILLIMERLYDNKFLASSHGFRPGKGTHTAMKQLESCFQSVKYVIEADFSKAFDSIPHDVLMNRIKEEIKCEKTIKLIRSALKAGYVEFGVLHDNLESGTPQGSILSPLLCNIFLHKLDVFIEELKVEYQKGTKRKLSQEYTKLQNQSKY